MRRRLPLLLGSFAAALLTGCLRRWTTVPVAPLVVSPHPVAVRFARAPLRAQDGAREVCLDGPALRQRFPQPHWPKPLVLVLVQADGSRDTLGRFGRVRDAPLTSWDAEGRPCYGDNGGWAGATYVGLELLAPEDTLAVTAIRWWSGRRRASL